MKDGPATNRQQRESISSEATKTLRVSKQIQGDLENQKFIFLRILIIFPAETILKNAHVR